MKTIDELWALLKDVELVQVRPSEMEILYKHCFEFEEPFIVEIGSAHGASSIILAEAATELNGVLHCFDTYPEYYYGQDKFGKYARDAFEKNMTPYQSAYTLHVADSSVALEILHHGIDILFIDGDHSYDGVAHDCRNLIPLLKVGGYVGFHDYNNPAFGGVKQAADEFTGNWPTESEWDLIVRRKP